MPLLHSVQTKVASNRTLFFSNLAIVYTIKSNLRSSFRPPLLQLSGNSFVEIFLFQTIPESQFGSVPDLCGASSAERIASQELVSLAKTFHSAQRRLGARSPLMDFIGFDAPSAKTPTGIFLVNRPDQLPRSGRNALNSMQGVWRHFNRGSSSQVMVAKVWPIQPELRKPDGSILHGSQPRRVRHRPPGCDQANSQTARSTEDGSGGNTLR
jgi:hypothetical protein